MCRPAAHRQHHTWRAEPWPAARRPVQPEPDPDLRVGDREREATAAALREHAAAGRLTVAELEERLDSALGARTHRDLRAPLADLPALATAAPAGRAPSVRAERADGLGAIVGPWLAVSLLLVLLWAFSGGGGFWPIWPIAGWGIAVVLRASAHLSARGARPHAPTG